MTSDAPSSTPSTAPPVRRTPRWRRILVGLLVVFGCVLAPISIIGVWIHNTVLDTDQWVDTVGPLIDDPAVQQAVATRVTNAVVDGTDLQTQVTDALPNRAKALAPAIVEGARQAAQAASLRIVESDRFSDLWRNVNRRAHGRVVAVLQGKGTETVETRNGQVTINLAPVIAAVQQELSDRGVDLFDDIDPGRADRQIVLFSSNDLRSAQDIVDLLDTLAYVLPILTLVVFVLAIALSGNRRRTILRGALGVAFATGLVLTIFNLGRTAYLDALPDTVNLDAAEALYDQVLTFLRTSLRTAFVLALVIAIGAWLAGAGHVAVRVRDTVRSALDRGRSEGAPSGVAVFVGHYKNALRVLVVALGLVVLTVIDHPSPASVLFVTVLVLVGLVVIEVLGRAAPPTPSAPDPA